MNKGRIVTVLTVVLVAVFVTALAVLLVFSLRTQFSPKPTQYPDSVWVSEDGAFTLTVGEYNDETYQCDAVLKYTSSDGGEFTYTVSDGAYSVIGVYSDVNNADSWLRVKCNAESFTARINRTASLEYSNDYEKAQKIVFKRIS